MSTRSAIIEKTKTGTYRGIYCHFDGYPDHQVPILKEHYMDPEKVSKLIDLGAISFLDNEVDIPEGVMHSYETPHRGVVVAYRRDRNEPELYIHHGVTENEVESQIGHNGHVYVFKDGSWYHNGLKFA